MLTIAIILALGSGSYFGFDKYKEEDRTDKLAKSCLELAKTPEDTKHCKQ